MDGIVHGGGLTAAAARYGGDPADWLDLSTGINPNMPDLPPIPVDVWNRLPDAGLVDQARVAARAFYLGEGLSVDRPPFNTSEPTVLSDISPSSGAATVDSGEVSRQTMRSGLPTSVNAPSTSSSGPSRGSAALMKAGPADPRDKPEDDDDGFAGRTPLPIPGTQSFIQILPRLVPPGRPVAIVAPTYGEYAHCFKAAGFDVDLIASPDRVRPDHGALVVVNPNNPDGKAYRPDHLLALHESLRSRGGHLHVDEAFGDGRPELTLAAYASSLPGLTVSRSFGKFFGMAGLRLGFVFAVPETLALVDAALGPWAVSGPALSIAAALMSRDRNEIVSLIAARKRALDAVLCNAGLTIAGGTDLFSLVRLDAAQALFDHLAHCHILVRKFDYAPDWLRFGLAADDRGDRRLAQALASFTA
jgi:cobalamin biosynthetic protein CobC